MLQSLFGETKLKHNSAAFLSKAHVVGDGADEWKGVECNFQTKLT